MPVEDVTSDMPQRVLLPTDGSDGTAVAADHAFALARVDDADVHVLSVVDTRNRFGGESSGAASATAGMRSARAEAERAVRDLSERAPDDVAVDTAVRTGVPHEAILRFVRKRDVDLVVMGTHGWTGASRVLLGSVAERVIRHSPAPVLAVPLDGTPRDDRSGIAAASSERSGTGSERR